MHGPLEATPAPSAEEFFMIPVIDRTPEARPMGSSGHLLRPVFFSVVGGFV